MSILIWLLTFVLILLSVFLVLIVLAQKSKSDGGVGAALGGGMTEATFGADSGNVLATLTRNGTIVFFVLTFGLFLAHLAKHKAAKAEGALPTIPVPAAEAAPATPTTTEATPAVESLSAPATTEAATTEPVLTLPAVPAPTTTEAAPATTEPAK
ncbi:MAG: preprotein translocase subunit SecG [Burkholderiales bacterium]|nr:preprotein translocase subunit SecG [Opitutaceae bacterium]